MKLYNPPRLTGRYLDPVMRSRWLTSGPMCEKLQSAVAAWFNVRPEQVVLGASATACFQACLWLISLCNRRHGRLYIAKGTWPGMHQATWLVPGIQRQPSRYTADIIVLTDIGGRRLCPEDEVQGFPPAVQWLIHDACHSWTMNRNCDFTLVSFYPTKLVPGAEGGAVICHSPDLAWKLRQLLYCGLEPGRAGMGIPPLLKGMKANMTDIAAALNLEALERAPRYIEAQGKAWERMAEVGRDMNFRIRQQPTRPYLMQLEVPPGKNVRELIHRLKERGIPAAWNFPPNQLLTLPCHPSMTRAEMRRIFANVIFAENALRL